MQKLLSILIALALLFSYQFQTAEADQPIKVILNGKYLNFDVEPSNINGSTMVPIRVIFEELGLNVGWDAETNSVTGANNSTLIKFQIGNLTAKRNGQKIILNAPAVVKNERTFVPIRFIAESAGASVKWDETIRTVFIISNTSNLTIIDSGVNEEDLNILKEKVVFDNDIRIFTLFSFLNFTGYDDENNPNGYSEIRKMVRQDLEKMDLQLIDNNYYANRKVNSNKYVRALKNIGDAPDFKLVSKINIEGIEDLNVHLKDFYQKANIKSLYERYKPYYDEEKEKYEDIVLPTITETNHFLKIDNDNVKNFYININPLDAYWRGSGLGNIDKFKKAGVIILGSSDEPNLTNVVHEYLHGAINPILNDLDDEINRTSYKFTLIKNNPEIIDVYPSWRAVMEESVIRALELHILPNKQLNNSLNDLVDRGFIVSPYIYRHFENYHDSKTNLPDYLKIILDNYDK